MEDRGAVLVVQAYDPSFSGSMWLTPDQLGDPAILAQNIARLEPAAQQLLDTLRVSCAATEPIADRFRKLIETDGDDLWRAGLLIPRITPSRGATIDPRYYAGVCRLNMSLARLPLWPDLLDPTDHIAHPPPANVAADAVVVSAAVEQQPIRLTQAGVIRKDDHRRLLQTLGDDQTRWQLALDWARETGLIRVANATLYGYPESNPRPLTDPFPLIGDAGVAAAAGLLLRVTSDGWTSMAHLEERLQERCPEALAPRTRPRTRWSRREGIWMASAADLLHRLGLLDAIRGPDGVVAIRRARPAAPRGGGFILTPDRDILVEPADLPSTVYGRLCRVAPYVEGERMHRHHLTVDGVAADMAQGQDDLLAWLSQWSRTGVPTNVDQQVRDWLRTVARIKLFSGVSVLEDPQCVDDRFGVWVGPPPTDARVLDYRGTPPGRIEVVDGHIRVPFGEDSLLVRSLADRTGMQVEPDHIGLRWEIAPEPTQEPDELLQRLQAVHSGELPGELEAAVRGAAGNLVCVEETVTLLQLPAEAAAAIARDRIAGPLLRLQVDATHFVVRTADLVPLRHRLGWLGYQVHHGDPPDDLEEPDTGKIPTLAPRR